jgi:bacterioferritin (cytochrome b1)
VGHEGERGHRRPRRGFEARAGAINQYWLYCLMLDNWGFTKLAKKERQEATPTNW